MAIKFKDLRNGLLGTAAGTAGVAAFNEYLNPTVTNVLPELAFFGLGSVLIGKTTFEFIKSARSDLRDKSETDKMKENLKEGVKNIVFGVALPIALGVATSASNFLYDNAAKGNFALNHVVETLNNTQVVSITNDISSMLTLTGCALCFAASTEYLVNECKDLFKRNDRF
ncbi:MAG: hypothetical protein ACP5M9_04040 [Candidatus Micrarchaeia archaeon]